MLFKNVVEAPDALKTAFFNKTAADGHIELIVYNWLTNFGQIAWVVLTVTVHLNGDIIVMLYGVQITGLYAAANAQVDGQVQVVVAVFF